MSFDEAPWPGDDEQGDEVELGYDAADEPDYFARVMYYVLDFPGLNRIAKDAYICLVRGLGWGRQRRKMTRVQLAAVMSISTDTFDRGIKELTAKGLVEVIRRRDPETGNWSTSSYLLKDTKSARLQARIVELEQALSKGQGKPKSDNATSSQVAASPQNAARTDEDNQGGGDSHRSANCGLDLSCDDAQSAQVGTVPQSAEPPGRNLRNRRAADCGHIREGSLKREEKREENTPTPPTPPGTAAPTGPASEEEGEGEASPILELVAEVRELKPGWGTRSIVRTLTHPDVAERPWPIVRRAMLAVAADSASQAPGRLLADGPWWNLPAHASTGATTAGTSVEWCGECRESTRRVEHPDTGDDLGPCPVCHYSRRAAS